MPPRPDLRQVFRRPRIEGVIRHLVQPMETQVIGATLEQSGPDGAPNDLADQRQIAMIELVLQRLGARRNDGFLAAQQRGQEIREGLAGAGAGLDDEPTGLVDRFRHRLGHPRLPGPGHEAGEMIFQGALRPEIVAQGVHSATIPRQRLETPCPRASKMRRKAGIRPSPRTAASLFVWWFGHCIMRGFARRG